MSNIDIASMTIDQLQEAMEAVEAQRETLRAEQEQYGAEINRRNGEGSLTRILDSISPENQAALVKLATVRLGAEVGGVN